MLPVLLDIQFIHLKIYTFGVFLVLAFFWGTFLLWRNVRLTSYKESDIFDGIFTAMFGGLFLGRLVHVILHFDKFGFNILKFILVNGYPGIHLFGTVIGGVLTFLIFCHFKKIKFSEIIDYLSAPLFIAIGIGKLGAFFSGTEVGTKTNFFIGLRYVNYDGFRHLTAFYEALVFFIAAAICHKMLFQIRREKYWKGMTFFFFCWTFSLVYFIFDPIKDNKDLIMGQSVNGALSISLLLTFSLYFMYHLRSKIFGKMKNVTNSINHKNGKHTHSKVHKSTKEEAGGGTPEDSAAATETQS
jgi:prolipoprotein diacylglyceryltransferase